MFKEIVGSRLASVGLAGAIAVGVLGVGGVALAEGGSSSSPVAAVSSAIGHVRGNHPRAKVMLALRDDIVAKSGLTKADFKSGFEAGKSVNDILGANADSVKAQVLADAQAKIATASSNGTISPDQATKLSDKLPGLLDKMFSTVPDGSHANRIKAIGKEALSTAAGVIGVEPKALAADLKGGQSIAQVAGAKTPDVIAALDAKADTAIDTAVSNGKVKAENADALKTKAHARIEEFVNKTR